MCVCVCVCVGGVIAVNDVIIKHAQLHEKKMQ